MDNFKPATLATIGLGCAGFFVSWVLAGDASQGSKEDATSKRVLIIPAILFMLIIVAATVTAQQVNSQCFNNCIRQGHNDAYCMDACTYYPYPYPSIPYAVQPPALTIPQIYGQCMNNCLGGSYTDGYCQSVCSAYIDQLVAQGYYWPK